MAAAMKSMKARTLAVLRRSSWVNSHSSDPAFASGGFKALQFRLLIAHETRQHRRAHAGPGGG